MENHHEPPLSPPKSATDHHRRDCRLTLDVMNPNLDIVPTPMSNKEEENSEMDEGKCNHNGSVSRCKRKMHIESLPDEMVCKILVWLPPQQIHNLTRFVCWKWYHMLRTHSFIYANINHSTPGLLIQNRYMKSKYHPYFVAMRQGRIEISKFTYKFEQSVFGSCNGLVLQCNMREYYGFYIANPATKQRFALPPCSSLINYSSLAYAASYMVYKVVQTYFPKDKLVRGQDCWGNLTFVPDCAITTVGVDNSWRYLNTNHLPITARALLSERPLTTEGFVHWTACQDTHVLTLNIETEVMTPIALPEGYGERWKYYLSTGSSLTILVVCGECSWEVWELNPEIGEWTKLPNIDLEAQKCEFEQLTIYLHDGSRLQPVGWLNHQQVVVFQACHPSRVCVAYNVHTQQIDYFELDPFYESHDSYSSCQSHDFHFHRDSLVWLDGC